MKFNHVTRGIEMYLQSTYNQTGAIRKTDFSVTLNEGETILTRSNHRFLLMGCSRGSKTAVFRCQEQCIDGGWPCAESLLVME